jgi:F0F1-type ATP synthase membrane subunit b/b'
MPQFDISSFFIQLIWLFIALIGFYTFLCIFYLPITSQYIKARRTSIYQVKFANYLFLSLKQAKSLNKRFVLKKILLF